MDFKKYTDYVDKIADQATDLSDFIFDHPELGFDEYESSGAIMEALRKNGFTVTAGIAGMPTAFKAEYGSGKPSMGVLAEFDAISALNYEPGKTSPVLRTDVANGHGCGHNLFAGGSFAAVLAVKNFIDENKYGKITLFGCPAEESGGGKVYMARSGVFDGIDAIVSWHPESMNMVRTRPSLANVEVEYSFTGRASHAGAAPQAGRSALDAAELMNIGTNFLREHMDTTSRIHYAFLDVGGTAPNIVQSTSKLCYLIRATNTEEVLRLYERVNKIAQGAALMTETTETHAIVAADSALVTIPSMQKLGYEVMKEIPVPVPTEEELRFGKELQDTIDLTEEQKRQPLYADKALEPIPPKPHGGSTDTADVSHCCPTLQFHIATWITGTPGHSWQSTTQGKSSFAHKALLYAGKVVSGTIIRLMSEPDKLRAAKDDFDRLSGGKYVCPLPDYVVPAIPDKK